MGKKVLLVLWLLPLFVLAAQPQVLDIGVKGMTCDFCVEKVQSGLSKLPGVEKVDVSLEQNRARVMMKPGATADVESMKKTILDAGFTPGEVSTLTQE